MRTDNALNSADSDIGSGRRPYPVSALGIIQFGVASGSHHADCRRRVNTDQVAVSSGRYASLTCARTMIGLPLHGSRREGGIASLPAQPARVRRKLSSAVAVMRPLGCR
jgi:hypothetical protein